MNAEIFAEWQRRQGHQVIKTGSSYWYCAGPRVFQAFPFRSIIQPAEKELRELLLGHGVAAARFSTPFDFPEGIASYHVVLNGSYSMDQLNHQAKNNIRRGLRSCQVKTISLSRLAGEGWNAQYDTLKRQGRTRSMSRAEWERLCLSADNLPGFEAWGATINGVLAASILTVRIEDTCYVPYAQCLHEYMAQHVNHALFYIASCEMLSQSGVKEIFYTLHSLDAPESINEFKFRMGFQARPVRQRVVFHPWIAAFAKPATHRLLLRLVHDYPESHFLSKAEGMLRFYLQGKKPLDEQEWPKCLLKAKEEDGEIAIKAEQQTILQADEKELTHVSS
ncbi:MAG: hypothetical protein IH586_20460 [Anaerolineaceae bacterium]|nr:hypothetical protein [Anaerolineaceae bacterium]